MRIAILAPWFRTLAQLHGREIERLGGKAIVLTTPSQPDSEFGFVEEILLPAEVRTTRWLFPWAAAKRAVKRFAPDLVLADESWDLRFTALAGSRGRISAVHDPQPHDLAQRRTLGKRLAARAAGTGAHTLAFSARSADALGTDLWIPLTSEYPDDWVPPIPEKPRQDFVVLGRMHPYKNVPLILEGWAKFLATPEGRHSDDRLILLGDGAASFLGKVDRLSCRPGTYRTATALQILGGAKASLCVYTGASQSGVQRLSHQAGTSTVVSQAGSLAADQPPDHFVIRSDSSDQLSECMVRLVHPEAAASMGAQAAAFYDEKFSQAVVGERLWELLTALLGG